ncbi:MAG: hypothetical protein CL575_09355 [Altererythrobacter sp.]|nr:hypothetical protein [Altererythrobacter sp.]MBK63129.1 hypothetical protein [Altererythrobacter sp.]PZT92586.1 MAG: hypothetical protein DI637_00505 [Citromicrobium sp.]|tara:strand:+ start:22072 stop:23790 length:1719 start_codon:yes stop_codon:yes gene_type:complete
MSAKPILQPLVHLPGVSEILGLGRVRESPHGGLEAHIECLIQPDIFNKNASSPVREWLGVGQMNLLWSGRQFKNGRPAGNAPVFRFEGKLTTMEEEDRETLGSGRFTGTAAKERTAGLAGVPGWLLRHEGRSIETNDEEITLPKVVFLPKTELVRALFGSSSDLLKQVIDGRRDPAVHSSRYALDRDRCFVSDAREVTISVSRLISEEDAHILAAIFADRSKRLLQFHDSIHQNLVTDPAYRSPVGAFLQAQWPWPNGVEMAFSGRWLGRDKGSGMPSPRFVVTRIEKIVFPSPPTSIEVFYPKETKTDKAAPQPDGRKIPQKGRSRPVRSDRVPDRGRMTETIPSHSAIFTFAEAIDVKFDSRELVLGRKDIGLRGDPIDGERFLSTDDARYGGDAATGQAKIAGQRGEGDDEAFERAASLARQKTWQALEKLAVRNGWKVTYWREDNSGVAAVSYRPDADEKEAPLVATVEGPSVLKAVADVGSASDDPASIGIVERSERPSPELLARDVFDLARANDWKWIRRRSSSRPRPQPQTRFAKATGHSRSRKCWEDSDYYAEKLEEWLEVSVS